MTSFVETPLFSRLRDDYLSDDALAAIEAYLSREPEAGDVIPGTGGVRKLRWAATGRGKRGGLRVIYYLRRAEGEIWLITLYAKNVRESIPARVLHRIREEIERGQNDR